MVTMDSTEFSFAYHSPIHLLDSVEHALDNVSTMEQKKDSKYQKTILINQCNFIVMCAVAIEAHLNWYYYFDQNIDVTEKDENNRIKYSTEWKIKKAPIDRDTKGECQAIFRLRNEVVHPKYSPRNPSTEYLYDISFMFITFNTLVNIVLSLLEVCPETLKGRIALSESQNKLANFTRTVTLKNKEGRKINWVEEVNTNKVGLPIPNVFHIEK